MNAREVRAMEREPWFVAQRERWDALMAMGWEFEGSPGISLSRVGLKMMRGDATMAVGLPKTLEARDIHTRMLEACEKFAELNP